MNEFNKKHMNHNFDSCCELKSFVYPYEPQNNIFKCLKCNIKIYFSNNINGKYFTFTERIKSRIWSELKLTCEEEIIKNIIE